MNPTYKKQIALFLILASSTSAFAAGEMLRDTFNSFMFWAFVLAGVILIITLAALNKSLNAIKYLAAVKTAKEEGVSIEESKPKSGE